MSYGSANYYVQQLYATNKGTHVVPALMNNAVVAGQDSLYASATVDSKTNEIIIKFVNANPTQKTVSLNITGNGKLAKTAKVITLSSTDMQAENSVDQPTRIAPLNKEIKVSGKTITYDAEPSSLNVIRIKRT